MNRISFAFFVALLVHIVLFLLLYLLYNSINIQKTLPQKKENKIKISLKKIPKTKQKTGTTKKIVKNNIPMPLPKGKQLRKKIKPKYKKIIKKVVKKKKVIKKTVLKKKKSPQIFKPKKKEPLVKNDPLAWLNQDLSQQEKKQVKKIYKNQNNISQDIRELYGDKFSQLTQGQQQYLIDNQEIMRRITQRVLNRVASTSSALQQLKVKSKNTIEFYLYPNGDISDIKFLSKSGYFEIDETTKETIEYAYSKYPRPTEKTLIRYRVFYDLK